MTDELNFHYFSKVAGFQRKQISHACAVMDGARVWVITGLILNRCRESGNEGRRKNGVRKSGEG